MSTEEPACGFGLLQSVRGTISRTRDYTVTPPGKLASLHLTPTRIITVVVVRLICFSYIRIEILLEELAPRRHVSVPVVWSILSVRCFYYPFARNVLDTLPRNYVTDLPLLPICILAARTEFTGYGTMP